MQNELRNSVFLKSTQFVVDAEFSSNTHQQQDLVNH